MVNNLTEGKSLLEMITGKIYTDIKTKATRSQMQLLYMKNYLQFPLESYRKYNIDIKREKFVKVDAELDLSSTNNQIDLKNILSTEKILTNHRIRDNKTYR